MILLTCLLLGQSGLPAKPALAEEAAPAGVRTDWQIHLRTLRVVDVQEEGCIVWPICSDGDEPYFVVIQFGAQYKTSGSAQSQWSGYLEENWAKGVDDNAVRTIPEAMGKVNYANVNIITRDDFYCRQEMPGGIGALVIAMEHDGTPFSLIKDIMNNLKKALEDELRPLIADGGLTLINAEADVRAAVQRIMDKVSPGFWKSAEILLASGGDPDDLIGYHVLLFGAADARVKSLLTIPTVPNTTIDALQPLHFESNPGPLLFATNDTRYEVIADLIAVTPVPDVPVAGLTVQGNSQVRVAESFSVVASVTNGVSVTYDWDWGDGSKGICAATTHVFSRAGRYTVTVTASTAKSSQTAQFVVEVAPPAHTSFLPLIESAVVAQ
jgi:hypothetical protein